MKRLSILMLLTNLLFLHACNRDDAGNNDEVTIERQEDYNREDATEQETIPVKRQNEELDLD